MKPTQHMKQLPYSEILQLLKGGDISSFNVYNADIPIHSHYSSEYYLQYTHDIMENDQIINRLFLDIEVHIDTDDADGLGPLQNANFPINAITICDTQTKIFRANFLLMPHVMSKFGISNDPNFNFAALMEYYNTNFKKIMIEKRYIDDSYSIQITAFDDESKLLLQVWQDIHVLDPEILSGWNSDGFDFPYIYYRLVKLFGESDTQRIMSKFGIVRANKGHRISIPEFSIADLLYLYKPRDEGGLNLGKKRSRYTLDNIAEVELGLKKLEYKTKNVTLVELYNNDPVNFLLYNIIDVALCVQLDVKLKHIDLYNSIRRVMKTPFQQSIAGSSVTFDSFIYTSLCSQNKFVRYGIISEGNKTIEPQDVIQFPQPKNKRGIPQKPAQIKSKDYKVLISKFPGAFVKLPKATIINDGSLVIDMDAKALYPSMIGMSNISFDSYVARVIAPCVYKMLNLLDVCLGKQPYPQMLFVNLEQMAWTYVNLKKPQKQDQTATSIYYTLLRLFDILAKSGMTLQQIFNPQTDQAALLQRTTLFPLIDLINWIHPDNRGHNKFAYDYLFMDWTTGDLQKKYDSIYIINNVGGVNSTISKVDINVGIKFIQQYIITLAGTLFLPHEQHLGLFTDFLQTMADLRKKYKDMRQASDEGSYAYRLNDNRQNSVKVIMNTTKLLVLILVTICSKLCELSGYLNRSSCRQF